MNNYIVYSYIIISIMSNTEYLKLNLHIIITLEVDKRAVLVAPANTLINSIPTYYTCTYEYPN